MGWAKQETAFHELSMSRLGYYGDNELARMIFDELKKRGLAKDSEDNVSIPMHPKVRSLVLVLLSQILRPYGNVINANLGPATDMPKMVRALSEQMVLPSDLSSGQVFEFDLNTVGVDLAPFPIDDVLDYRAQNLAAHRRYTLSVRKFAIELSRMSAAEQKVAFEFAKRNLVTSHPICGSAHAKHATSRVIRPDTSWSGNFRGKQSGCFSPENWCGSRRLRKLTST